MAKEHYAILSGACAASASIFGKFSGSSYLDVSKYSPRHLSK